MVQNIKIGILGGGQLGKMLLQPAMDYDLDISVMDADAECSCSQLAPKFIQGDITDFDAVYDFGKDLDIITIEIENVNVEALKKLESEGKSVYPQPSVIETIKNKQLQKKFYSDHGIPTAEFINVKDRDEIRLNKDSIPGVNKLAVGGYDGRGVQVLKSEKDISKAFDQPGILERLIDFEKELAIIVARNADGDVKCFPLVEMVFHPVANLVEYQFSPAFVNKKIEEQAKEIAIKTANSFRIVGLLAVEMFLTRDGRILVNESAPRPHNSGHQTMKANPVSQFEQHWRAILNLPLGSTRPHQLAAMVNILGEEGHTGEAVVIGLKETLREPGIYPFFYGKKITKPYRKMGHVSILAGDFEKLKEMVNFVQKTLKIQAK